jgi:hypothetical protein
VGEERRKPRRSCKPAHALRMRIAGSEACSRCGGEWAAWGLALALVLDLILTLGLRLVRYRWRGGQLGALTAWRVWKAEATKEWTRRRCHICAGGMRRGRQLRGHR